MAPEPPTSAIFRALRSVDVDPELAHEAAEENRHEAGQNVIAIIGAKIDSQSARIDVQIGELRAEMKAGFAEVNARIDAQAARINPIESRINDLRQVIWRVIWPLIVLLAVPVFGLLYRVLTTTPG